MLFISDVPSVPEYVGKGSCLSLLLAARGDFYRKANVSPQQQHG
jgi:hypothetical protein